MNKPVLILALLLLSGAAHADEERVYRSDHVVVTYSCIDEAYVEAIATTLDSARAVCVEQFGFDMPETIRISVRANSGERVRLFNDGQDRLFLTVRSERDLRQPAATGIFHLYGLCHEVGHLAMYRPIADHSWITPALAEGWAHYIGSRIVDGVHARKGESLWPDPYDYLADGTQRLNRQLADAKDKPTTEPAQLWSDLLAIVGDKGIAAVFGAWGQTKFDPTDPGAAMRKALLATHNNPELGTWWNRAEPSLVFKRPKSGFAARTAKINELAKQPVDQAHDDGMSAGQKSIAGSGHAVRFSVHGDTWYLTAVRIHGSRYGYPRPPEEDFHVWLCDKDLGVIADFPFPYAKFARGESKWVTLPVRPTQVPQDFVVCAAFNPTATKGVYVSRDADPSGNSLTGLPGRGAGSFSDGDWLIRASIDQLKIANPLAKQETPSEAR